MRYAAIWLVLSCAFAMWAQDKPKQETGAGDLEQLETLRGPWGDPAGTFSWMECEGYECAASFLKPADGKPVPGLRRFGKSTDLIAQPSVNIGGIFFHFRRGKLKLIYGWPNGQTDEDMRWGCSWDTKEVNETPVVITATKEQLTRLHYRHAFLINCYINPLSEKPAPETSIWWVLVQRDDAREQ